MSAMRPYKLIAIAAFAAALLATPTPGSLQAGLNPEPVFVPAIAKSAPRLETRRVNADFCLTEAEMIANLAQQGFFQMVIGENTGRHSVSLLVRYGGSKYTAYVDRCTGRLQTIVPAQKSTLMYL